MQVSILMSSLFFSVLLCLGVQGFPTTDKQDKRTCILHGTDNNEYKITLFTHEKNCSQENSVDVQQNIKHLQQKVEFLTQIVKRNLMSKWKKVSSEHADTDTKNAEQNLLKNSRHFWTFLSRKLMSLNTTLNSSRPDTATGEASVSTDSVETDGTVSVADVTQNPVTSTTVSVADVTQNPVTSTTVSVADVTQSPVTSTTVSFADITESPVTSTSRSSTLPYSQQHESTVVHELMGNISQLLLKEAEDYKMAMKQIKQLNSQLTGLKDEIKILQENLTWTQTAVWSDIRDTQKGSVLNTKELIANKTTGPPPYSEIFTKSTITSTVTTAKSLQNPKQLYWHRQVSSKDNRVLKQKEKKFPKPVKVYVKYDKDIKELRQCCNDSKAELGTLKQQVQEKTQIFQASDHRLRELESRLKDLYRQLSNHMMTKITRENCNAARRHLVGNSCYFIPNIKQQENENLYSWWDARYLCKQHLGTEADLVTIETREEMDGLKKLLVNHFGGVEEFWLGGTDLEEEGQWKWSGTGESVNQQIYRNWAYPPAPNTNKNCMAMLRGYHWVDEPCFFQRYPLCELTFQQ